MKNSQTGTLSVQLLYVIQLKNFEGEILIIQEECYAWVYRILFAIQESVTATKYLINKRDKDAFNTSTCDRKYQFEIPV